MPLSTGVDQSKTLYPASARLAATLTAMVVLPTSPFLFPIAIFRKLPSRFILYVIDISCCISKISPVRPPCLSMKSTYILKIILGNYHFISFASFINIHFHYNDFSFPGNCKDPLITSETYLTGDGCPSKEKR